MPGWPRVHLVVGWVQGLDVLRGSQWKGQQQCASDGERRRGFVHLNHLDFSFGGGPVGRLGACLQGVGALITRPASSTRYLNARPRGKAVLPRFVRFPIDGILQRDTHRLRW
ncbi:MAG: hypothetical protein ACPIOQ_69415, partial [Promethearchaeia archaeon]